MESMARVQTLDEAVCISLRINDLEKGMKPFGFTPAIDKQYGRLLSSLVWQTFLDKENWI